MVDTIKRNTCAIIRDTLCSNVYLISHESLWNYDPLGLPNKCSVIGSVLGSKSSFRSRTLQHRCLNLPGSFSKHDSSLATVLKKRKPESKILCLQTGFVYVRLDKASHCYVISNDCLIPSTQINSYKTGNIYTYLYFVLFVFFC